MTDEKRKETRADLIASASALIEASLDLHKVPDGILRELIYHEKSPETLQKLTQLLKDPSLSLVGPPPASSGPPIGENGLIHGVYCDREEMKRRIRVRMEHVGLDHKRLSYPLGIKQLGGFDPLNPEHVVTPVIRLGNRQRTLSFLWDWLRAVYRDMTFNKRLHDGDVPIESFEESYSDSTFRPWTVTWRALSLNANLGVPASEIVHPAGECPGLALLTFACLHPDRFRAIRRPCQDFRIDGLHSKKAPDDCLVLMGPYLLNQVSMVVSLQPKDSWARQRSSPIFL